MRRVAAVALGCAAVAAVVLWLTFFRASDEERIRRVLGELVKIVSVKEGDTLLSRTARLRSKLPDVVDDDVRVSVAEGDFRDGQWSASAEGGAELGMDTRGRQKLEEDAARAGLVYSSADCELANVAIRVDPEGSLAQVDAVALVTASRGGERNVDRRDVHFLLRRDDRWKITTIDVAPKKSD